MSSKVVNQALFFLANEDLLPSADVVLAEWGSSPRIVAKTPSPMKGKYIINSLSDALPDHTSSDKMGTWKDLYKFKKMNNNIDHYNFF